MDSRSDQEFAGLAREYLDDRAERHPDAATELGDHRFDAHLADLSAGALASERRALGRWARKAGALQTGALTPEHQVDAAMLANDVTRRIFELDELRDRSWPNGATRAREIRAPSGCSSSRCSSA